jgi:ribosomal protein S6E (S10)
MQIPDPLPMPMSAVPASPMMVRTSAKSTLISPGLGYKKRGRGVERRREKRGKEII